MGTPISDQEHTNVILDGLGDEYHPFITSINNREPPLSIPDLEASLMAEEELIERLKKPDTTMVQVNVNQIANQSSRSNNSESQQSNWNSNNNNNWNSNNQDKRNSINSGKKGRGGRGGRGGRNNWNTNNNRPQCQICGKLLGHVVIREPPITAHEIALIYNNPWIIKAKNRFI
ncbi:hypothetical protein PIB30_011790 [Stylosanthes scabra]|uniref:Uncharacterized protein n=1 Tax=Stylosanthes scabra TaxID=79078 RepID=A0ABU6R4T0_9FABA|nr:hypothetical protein [Stylosanthes scabra]